MANNSMTGRNPYLECALEMLAKLDGEVNVALAALGAALEVCVPIMPLKMCAFEYDGAVYGALVTETQRQAIMKTVTTNGDIFGQVAALISDVNVLIAKAYDDLSGSTDGMSIKAPAPPVLGCCVCASGKIPNLTQAQCNHFNPTSWGDPADCSGVGP